VFSYDNRTGKWTDVGLKNADYVAAGTNEQIYALAEPKKGLDYTVYALSEDKWFPLPGKGGQRIAVGQHGKIYLIQADKTIHLSTFSD
jgi:hypothetical protein